MIAAGTPFVVLGEVSGDVKSLVPLPRINAVSVPLLFMKRAFLDVAVPACTWRVASPSLPSPVDSGGVRWRGKPISLCREVLKPM